jgi:hypothetical protein
MSYTPANHSIIINDEDVSELKVLLDDINRLQFDNRARPRLDDSLRSADHLKKTVVKILDQIPRT